MEIDAENPIEAARRALSIQRDPVSTATVIEVRNFGRYHGPAVVVDADAENDAEAIYPGSVSEDQLIPAIDADR
jgi:hypothetical protein